MSYATNNGSLEWTEQAPIPFDQWKALLYKLTKDETTKQFFCFHWNTRVCFLRFVFHRLSSNSNPHHRTRSRHTSSSSSPTKKQDRQALPRNQVFTDTTVDSFLISSTNIIPSAIGMFSQDNKNLDERIRLFVQRHRKLRHQRTNVMFHHLKH